MSLQVLRRACRRCNSTLQGLSEDVVFTCTACLVAFEVTPRGLIERTLTFREVSGPTDLWLPFWALRCRTGLTADEPARLRDYSLADEVEVFVKGFVLRNVSRIGNPGMELTREGAPPLRAPPDPLPPLLGCQRTAAAAEMYAHLFLLDILDQQSDITGVELKIAVQAVSLTWLPFADWGDELMCLATRKKYPAGLVDDIAELRSGAAREGAQ